MSTSIKKYVVEAIGTFFLVLVIGLSVINPGAGLLAPIAIGTMLMIMVYAGKYISGGHYNPAVTLGIWMRGGCDRRDVPFYMAAQILGACLAALAVNYIKPANIVELANPNIPRALAIEFLFTFALVYVYLTTTTSKSTAGNSYFGAAIGLTIMVAAYAGGNISGGIFNPAVAIGTVIMKLINIQGIWLYFVGNLAGGAAAAVVFKFVNAGEEHPTNKQPA